MAENVIPIRTGRDRTRRPDVDGRDAIAQFLKAVFARLGVMPVTQRRRSR